MKIEFNGEYSRRNSWALADIISHLWSEETAFKGEPFPRTDHPIHNNDFANKSKDIIEIKLPLVKHVIYCALPKQCCSTWMKYNVGAVGINPISFKFKDRRLRRACWQLPTRPAIQIWNISLLVVMLPHSHPLWIWMNRQWKRRNHHMTTVGKGEVSHISKRFAKCSYQWDWKGDGAKESEREPWQLYFALQTKSVNDFKWKPLKQHDIPHCRSDFWWSLMRRNLRSNNNSMKTDLKPT